MAAPEPSFSYQRHHFSGRKKDKISLHPVGCFYFSNQLAISILLFKKISGTLLVFKKHRMIPWDQLIIQVEFEYFY